MSNKIKFYKVNYSFTTIDIVYADSETESFVIIKGSREKKDGQHESYFKTFEETIKRQLAITHADRKKWWTNYNADLVNRISEIKKATT